MLCHISDSNIHDHNYCRYANKAKCWINEGKANFNSINTFWNQVYMLQSKFWKTDLKNKTTHTHTHTQGRERNEEKKEKKGKRRKEKKKRDPVWLYTYQLSAKYCQWAPPLLFTPPIPFSKQQAFKCMKAQRQALGPKWKKFSDFSLEEKQTSKEMITIRCGTRSGRGIRRLLLMTFYHLVRFFITYS